MFKKFLTILIALVAIVSVASCKKPTPTVERTFVADGEYTAFKAGLNYGAPQVNMVTVTIKNDKIESFNIDCIQSTATKNAENVVTAYNFNDKSKKELGYAYHMHYFSGYLASSPANPSDADYATWLKANNKLEWFEQANLIEKAWVEKGVDAITLDETGHFTNVAGVTITDNDYVALAKEAVANAKAGKMNAVSTHGSDIVWAQGKVAKDGKLSEVKLDTLQGKLTAGTFAWNQKTKQELGYAYHMHYYSGYLASNPATPSDEDYAAWLKANNKLEWFEQAALVVSAFQANHSVAFDAISTVTISDNSYLTVLTGLYACVK